MTTPKSDHLNINLPDLDPPEVDPIWEYQPEHETYTQYNYFEEYYLNQPAPRSVIGAYRLYRAKQKGVTVDDDQIKKIRKLPKRWDTMAYNLDGSGNKIEDTPLKTWKERAAAYDRHLYIQVHVMTQQRKILSTMDHLSTIDDIKKKWDEMWRVAKILRKTGVTEMNIDEIDSDGQPVTVKKLVEIRELNTMQLWRLIRAYDELVELERRELGLPSEIRQTQIADHEGNEYSSLPTGLTEDLQAAIQDVQDWKQKSKK